MEKKVDTPRGRLAAFRGIPGKKPARPGVRTCVAAVLVTCLLTWAGCKQQGGPPPQGAPEVAVLTVQPERVVLTTDLPGRTAAFLISEIRPQVNGLIQKRLFEEGAEVKAGDVLYQIDPAPFEAALASAKASLARAEAGLVAIRLRVDRYKGLLADKAISQQDYDDASAAMKQAEAEIAFCKAAVRTAEINLAYTRVTAPISGRIGKSSVTEGALVTAYQPVALATIQQLDPIYVDVPQSTTQLLRLQRRMEDGRLNPNGTNQNKVKLVMEDGVPFELEGTLQFQDITVDPTTGSVILRVLFPNPDRTLLPGMFVRAVISEGVNEKAILVPQQAVSRNSKGEPMAMIVNAGNTVEPRMLTLDRAIGDKWLVASGLAPGDRVIVDGLQKARPGAVVAAVPLMKADEADAPAERTASVSVQ
ncbi:MAG TPA: efflux RND transporter periplasmic adaptor subunit [Anaerohalosphaeraceae bacterium]|jgi:membrane fusion protein (multidrug efflux system)|nr:efflux RND transporter periplasmic adaptor subunit [Anaerohalosphaeraceae bacterium]HRT49617.1 efflux RND transporter periplasmic adaptor subunit [Anaerohalosphaeraceae bacterium]HRT85448.1 efflux RND transporter periplasmic adaptor subunit [Anaerohalosphaeraceae bacterium]